MTNETLKPAAGYLRKSRKGQDANGKAIQEKSIPQQKKEIEELAKQKGYVVVKWYDDPGVSGWKLGLKRPGFYQMLKHAEEHRAFEAIIVDNLDRFSRAEVSEVQSDANKLKKAGVLHIISAAQGDFYLGKGNDIGQILYFTVTTWAAHEYSRQLGRRIALARRNRAEEGKRSGGIAPFGYDNDGAGSLKLGPKNEVETVQWIFEQFVGHSRSMNSITAELNATGVTTKNGKRWYVQRIKELLQRRVYAGDFTYNQKKTGQFYIIDENRQVVPIPEGKRSTWKPTTEGMFLVENNHQPIIKREVFDAAQKRFGSFKMRGSRKPRDKGYALTGVLVCSHCGKPLYGCEPKGRHREYRCPSNAKTGAGSCGYYVIREDVAMPKAIEMLSKHFGRIEVRSPKPIVKFAKVLGGQIEVEIGNLEKKISNATDLLIDSTLDERTNGKIRERLGQLYMEQDKLQKELDDVNAESLQEQDCDLILKWWRDFRDSAVTIPVHTKEDINHAKRLALPAVKATGGKARSAQKLDDGWGYMLTPRGMNEALMAIGCEMRVTWEQTVKRCKNGNTVPRNVLRQISMNLGENMPSFCTAPVVAACSGNRGEGRCGSRRDMGSMPRPS